ncbi:MFS transporter, ACS family, solute carrier family 17, member 5 [Paragonimus westermani]|uniref:MFS transporter, ACS family, solute carrier family 17, member 5 n=1 Tax=Paragonimus westermani TaxID=34504 RepID=A0A5J4NG64_9TREM|nr:MFS transporter, ACS family, solute carrier family 17, member 5 [Paragonimus westermani]
MLYAFRIVAGLASAAWFPSFYQIWALWAPPNERGILIGLSYAGVHIGNAITLPIAGALCQTSIGWPLVFYFYGASCIVYVFAWLLFIYDTPKQHPMISEREKSLIISVCGTTSEKSEKKPPAPVLAMLKSLPLWAFVVVVVGYDWNSYTFLTSMPTFMRDALRFDINEASGKLVFIMYKMWMFGPATMLLLISLFDCRAKYAVVALFTVGLLLSSGVFVGGLLNPVELSPQYAGLIFSAANTMSSLTGVGAPLLANILTPNKPNILVQTGNFYLVLRFTEWQSLFGSFSYNAASPTVVAVEFALYPTGSYEEWRNVFIVGATIYFVTGLFFVLFSSSSLQRWSHIVTEPCHNGNFELVMDVGGAKNEENSGGLVHGLKDVNGQPVGNPIFNPEIQQDEFKSRKIEVSV